MRRDTNVRCLIHGLIWLTVTLMNVVFLCSPKYISDFLLTTLNFIPDCLWIKKTQKKKNPAPQRIPVVMHNQSQPDLWQAFWWENLNSAPVNHVCIPVWVINLFPNCLLVTWDLRCSYSEFDQDNPRSLISGVESYSDWVGEYDRVCALGVKVYELILDLEAVSVSWRLVTDNTGSATEQVILFCN